MLRKIPRSTFHIQRTSPIKDITNAADTSHRDITYTAYTVVPMETLHIYTAYVDPIKILHTGTAYFPYIHTYYRCKGHFRGDVPCYIFHGDFTYIG
jgi:hypothetical protein